MAGKDETVKGADPKRTPLYGDHVERGARMTAFAGWEMPLQYPRGIIREHLHTRAGVSLFDTCHMGEIRVTGAGATGALEKVLARTVGDQKVGTCRYNLILSDTGGICDDLIAYRMADEEFLLVVNAGTREQDVGILHREMPAQVNVEDVSDETGKVDLQGPGAADVLARLGVPVEQLPRYFHWKKMEIGGDEVLASRTGYTGELGFELYIPADRVHSLWQRLLGGQGVEPAGLGARDTLRLEVGLPLYGHELDLRTTPAEAGFGGMLRPGGTVRGDIVLAQPMKKRRGGLAIRDRRAARAGATVYDEEKRRTGTVTSGSFGPSLGHAIALCYFDGQEERSAGSRFLVDVHGTFLEATVVELPFYRNGTARMKPEGGRAE